MSILGPQNLTADPGTWNDLLFLVPRNIFITEVCTAMNSALEYEEL